MEIWDCSREVVIGAFLEDGFLIPTAEDLQILSIGCQGQWNVCVCVYQVLCPVVCCKKSSKAYQQLKDWDQG